MADDRHIHDVDEALTTARAISNLQDSWQEHHQRSTNMKFLRKVVGILHEKHPSIETHTLVALLDHLEHHNIHEVDGTFVLTCLAVLLDI